MAEHRARHGAASGAIRAADLLARFDAGTRPPGHRHRLTPALGAVGGGALSAAALPPLALPRVSMPSLSMPSLSMPTLPKLPVPRLPMPISRPSAQTGRTLIAAMSTGAIGVTATMVAITGPAPVTPPQPAELQLAANPAAVPPAIPAAAAALTLPAPGFAEPAPAPDATPVTGADLATAALPAPAPAATQPAAPLPAPPVVTLDDAPDAPAPAITLNTPAPVPAAPVQDGTDPVSKAATKAAAKAAALAAADAAAKKTAAKEADPAPAAGSSAGARALSFARNEIGTPYRYGATGPSAYDCSGLVMAAFKKAGVSLPRTSAAQSKVGKPVSRDQLKPGDLVFFYSPVSHVGIYIGGGKMVHASTSGEPVKISDIGRRPFHNARRI